MVSSSAPPSGGNRVAAQPVQNRIVYGLTLMPKGFDPHINASSELGIVLRSVYDTLIYRTQESRRGGVHVITNDLRANQPAQARRKLWFASLNRQWRN